MRYFLMFILLIPVFCAAQDTINRKFIISVNFGPNLPENDYGTPPINTNNYGTGVYGYATPEIHVDANGIYFPSTNVNAGLAVRFGMDINQTSMVNQYMGGLYLMVKPKESNFNIHIIGLIGVVTADISNSDNGSFDNNGTFIAGFQTVTDIPGFGTGLGFYGGIGLSFNAKGRVYINLSVGYLYSAIDFPNGTVSSINTGNAFPPYNTYSTSKEEMEMALGIIQPNFGFSWHI
jgi:hypothetical protein